jgi:hypothetical protein
MFCDFQVKFLSDRLSMSRLTDLSRNIVGNWSVCNKRCGVRVKKVRAVSPHKCDASRICEVLTNFVQRGLNPNNENTVKNIKLETYEHGWSRLTMHA